MNGLLESERLGILAFVGTLMTIGEIDRWGGLWVGFDRTAEEGEVATFYGQSFLVEPQRIELLQLPVMVWSFLGISVLTGVLFTQHGYGEYLVGFAKLGTGLLKKRGWMKYLPSRPAVFSDVCLSR